MLYPYQVEVDGDRHRENFNCMRHRGTIPYIADIYKFLSL